MKTKITKSLNLALIACTLLIATSCDKNLEGPSINPNVISNVQIEPTFTTIELSGNIELDEDRTIDTSGFCWSTVSNPTINDNMLVFDNDSKTELTGLIVNTTYYLRPYTVVGSETYYGKEEIVKTLSFEGTSWDVNTEYPNEFEILSQIDFYTDNTTKFDEIENPGVFITSGSWSIEGNELTYIWEGSDPDLDKCTYVYTGLISGKSIEGNYTHVSLPNGKWSAALQ